MCVHVHWGEREKEGLEMLFGSAGKDSVLLVYAGHDSWEKRCTAVVHLRDSSGLDAIGLVFEFWRTGLHHTSSTGARKQTTESPKE